MPFRSISLVSGLVLLAAGAALAVRPQAPAPVAQAVRDGARPVFEALARIEAEAASRGARPQRRLEVTEPQLNDYIAVRIADEGGKVLRDLKLKLLAGNRIEGKALLDLAGAGLPLGLKPRMNIFFGGRLESADGRARLLLDGLFLEGQPVSPAVLNLAIDLGSRLEGTEPFRLDDWTPLPYGIAALETSPGRLVARY